ncbi:hypothetical protein Tco_1122569 [Tanacetum coccineum]|uniref:Uncharacterized protein n=1 Tax=Tanacetum coccineum TaxID=301880 RepID=A0ABQ5J142_9ASTR
MSTPVFVDLEISTQADGAQSPRVSIPFPEDPYEAISTPPTHHVEDLVDSNMFCARPTSSDFTAPLLPDHPLTHASPTLVPFLCRSARMAIRVPPAMLPGLSASIADVVAMSDSVFRKRFRSSYESLPSSSPPDLLSRKRYRGMSELVKDDEEEDEKIEESLNSDRDGGPGMRVESLNLRGDAAVPEGLQLAVQRAALWHVISDTQMENRELRLQIAEERHARLDLAEIVDSVRRG